MTNNIEQLEKLVAQWNYYRTDVSTIDPQDYGKFVSHVEAADLPAILTEMKEQQAKIEKLEKAVEAVADAAKTQHQLGIIAGLRLAAEKCESAIIRATHSREELPVEMDKSRLYFTDRINSIVAVHDAILALIPNTTPTPGEAGKEHEHEQSNPTNRKLSARQSPWRWRMGDA